MTNKKTWRINTPQQNARRKNKEENKSTSGKSNKPSSGAQNTSPKQRQEKDTATNIIKQKTEKITKSQIRLAR